MPGFPEVLATPAWNNSLWLDPSADRESPERHERIRKKPITAM
jgi:hypothetical protein